MLICSPWGYEELCTRSSWRELADRFAAAGFPTLRFDYPGAGDSLGSSSESRRLEDWVAASRAAATFLSEIAKAESLILVGQGLGAGIATLVALELENICGLVLLTGFAKGRAFVREMGASASLLADAAQVVCTPCADGRLNVLGFELSAPFVEDIKKVDFLSTTRAPAPRILFVGRPHSQQDKNLASHFAKLGACVESLVYEGYDQLVSSPTTAELPRATFDNIVATLGAWMQPAASTAQPEAPEPAPALEGETFREKRFRFGSNELFAVLCEPKTTRDEQCVLFLNAGANPHTGWRRSTVEHARTLAGHGVSSLRIDTSGIGDSPDPKGSPDKLYTEQQILDAMDAVDWLARRGTKKITLVGVCSGAYLALHTAVRDSRIDGIIIVNPPLFVWDSSVSIEEFLKFGTRTNTQILSRAATADGLIKLLKGQVELGRLARLVIKRARSVLADRLASLFPRLPFRGPTRKVHQMFSALKARGASVSLVVSEGDLGEHEIEKYFGRGGYRLAAYDNVTLSRLQGADHNLTSQESFEWFREHLLQRTSAVCPELPPFEKRLSDGPCGRGLLANGSITADGRDARLDLTSPDAGNRTC